MKRQSNARIITLKIDGVDIGARENETLLQLARENNVNIPTLCHLEGVSDWGGCRLCVVEIKGSNRLLPACMTYPAEGMEVFTNTPRLVAYRKMILDLLFSERNHVCAVCVSNGHCELQDMALELGNTHVGVPYLNPSQPVDASHPFFIMDHNRCILCQRCVRVCREVEWAQTKGAMGRGVNVRIIHDLNEPWGDSQTCTACGKCVQVCPTGALFQRGKAAGEMTKRREFLPYLRMMREE
ncbi:MAG: bidirectional hydrogenase complex protein HoxU [Anaerolinea sp.]|nr:bidirectional hydrogenase complex protein HoxU [Anaerolinea sp.]